MDRPTALRALGLPPQSSPRAVRAAYARMREHLLERALEAPDAADKARCLSELRALESVLARDLAGHGARAGRAVAGAVAVALVAGGVWWSLTRLQEIPVGEEVPVAAVEEPIPEPPPVPSELSVLSAVEGARFALFDSTAPEAAGPLATGPADGTVVSLVAPPGPLALQVDHADCAGENLEVVLEAGERLEVESQPCPRTGWLVVRSNVSRDRLTVDDRAVGPTGPQRHPLPIGDYALTVEKPGFVPWRQLTRIAPGELVVVRARLRPESADRDDALEDMAASITDDTGGTRGWFHAVSEWMVAHHDADGTGLIDAAVEVDGIPCQTWQALELSYETGRLGAPMSRLYGFDGSRWVPGALGFDVRVREQAYGRMRACGLR